MCKKSQSKKKGFLAKLGALIEALFEGIGEYDLDFDFD